MSLKKILFLCLFCLLCLFPLMDANAVSNIDYDIGSNGDGLDTSGSSSYCSVEQGCVHTINGNDYSGVRVTLVDDNGDIISGTHSMDFWNTIPYNARAKTGSKWRSYYINNYGSGLASESFTGVGGYVNSNVTDDTSLIGGINFKTQHELIENELNKEIENYKKTKKCEEFKLFSLLGYNDFCNDIKNPECEETLNKIYILVEPMYYVNYKKKNIAVTGTELAAMIYNTRINKGDNYSTANLNRSAFDNAITNMYLTGKDAQYDFKANNKVYNNFDAYASGLSDINIINYYNSSEEAKKVLKAAIGYSNDLYPLGNSMHLVWLGTWAGEVCEPKGCCIPCSVANVEGCDEDDCCYDEDLPISTDGTTEACVPFDEYWDGHDDEHDWNKVCEPKCIPSPSNDYCCDDEEFLNQQPPGYYEEYCMPKDGKCDVPSLKPEYIANYCDEDNENNVSYFRDAVFNSTNGQFSDWSKIEDIEEYIKNNDGSLPIDWINRVVSEYKNNTFLAIAYKEDTRYTTKINDYCNMHCQEIFEVELPDNYPYVNAGRYFKWTIKDSKSTIAKAIGGRLCAVDIDLDKAIEDYVDLNEKAQSAAYGAANLHCGNLEEWGLKQTNGTYTCDSYADKAKKIDGTGCNARKCKPGYNNYTQDTCYDEENNPYSCGCLYNDQGVSCCTQAETDNEAEERGYKEFLAKCKEIENEYLYNVVDYAGKAGGIIGSIEQCSSVGLELEMDMGVELNYQTSFGPENTYSTPDEINKTSGGGETGVVFACVDNEETNNCNKEEHKFVLSDRSNVHGENAISCKNSTTWSEEGKEYQDTSDRGTGSNTEESVVYKPFEVSNNKYNSGNVTMLDGIKGFDRKSGEYDGGESLYTFENTWNTIYMGFISNSDFYELNEKINACTCKNGEVQNLENGGCTCTKEVSYSNFTTSYNNYQTLSDGTLKVEFMNPTGLYPIKLRYWTIGSLDENGEGHFDSILTERSVDGTGHELCDDDGCDYDDPNGKCRLIIKNRIIATPDNNGNCDEPPCDPEPDDNGKCNNEPCADPDDFGDCIDSSGNFICEKSNDLNIIYRVIDLDNPFPGTDSKGRSPGVNWIGHEDIIKNNRGVEGNALYNSNNVEPLYSMTLTPALIKEIRAGNQASDPTLGYTSSVTYPTGPAEPGGGYSLFLHQYLEPKGLKINYDDSKQFNDIQKTGDGVK